MSFTIKPPQIDDPQFVKGYPVCAKIETEDSLIYLSEEDFNDLQSSIQNTQIQHFAKIVYTVECLIADYRTD